MQDFLKNEEDYPRVVFFFALADSSLLQKSLEDGLLGLLRGEPQSLQLQQLVTGDLADGGLVDQLCVGAVGSDGGDGLDVRGP